MTVEYTSAVGTKFHADGSMRRFPGVSVVCRLEQDRLLRRELQWTQQQFQILPLEPKFAFLPPESFHMTVFDMVCDQERRPEVWSKHLALDAPLTEVDSFLKRQYQRLHIPDGFRMHYDRLHSEFGLSVNLGPENEEAITEFRERLSEATGIRHPKHDRYRFHISLAYRLVQLTEDEERTLASITDEVDARLRETMPVITTGRPKLTFFNDMASFPEQRQP